MRTTFTSQVSFEDAEQQANSQGFTPVSRVRNPRGFFVVFATRDDSQVRSSSAVPAFNKSLKGKI